MLINSYNVSMYYFDTFAINKIKTQFTLGKIEWLLIRE
jgi:hypothetical protein